MCNRYPEAYLKNNKDIGRTTLMEMEIDTKPLHTTIKAPQMGTKGNRNTRKSCSNRKKPVPMGIASNSGPKEVGAR